MSQFLVCIVLAVSLSQLMWYQILSAVFFPSSAVFCSFAPFTCIGRLHCPRPPFLPSFLFYRMFTSHHFCSAVDFHHASHRGTLRKSHISSSVHAMNNACAFVIFLTLITTPPLSATPHEYLLLVLSPCHCPASLCIVWSHV
ncbi:hypothetical protein CRM22_003899 [Opisthorchis felineus]|uniref:Uncharacterized protein n=1 Tax=Opisthorchis felineus TaxID=147828 RepID=A0A4S2M542_OPIFE|nr:hypothetical protein CRM22_003899 [Opisthorchis felineus]